MDFLCVRFKEAQIPIINAVCAGSQEESAAVDSEPPKKMLLLA